MSLEIERKFLVNGNDFREQAVRSERIKQGYLSSNPDRNVRIRLIGNKAYITIKGRSDELGLTRFEWEKEIPIEDAEQLFNLCELGAIDKIRYYIPANDDLIFEVDEFFGDNKGLVVAEIELNTEDQPFQKPFWLGAEVTGEIKYYNSHLTQFPFVKWIDGK